jgi:hypothetical protein
MHSNLTIICLPEPYLPPLLLGDPKRVKITCRHRGVLGHLPSRLVTVLHDSFVPRQSYFTLRAGVHKDKLPSERYYSFTMPPAKAKGGGLFGDEDCERPACDDIKQTLPKSMEEFQAMTQKHAAKKKVECPPRSAELGRSSWKLLHSMVRERLAKILELY